MQRHFDTDLANLKQQLLTMGSHAEIAVSNSIKALLDRDEPLARKVIQDDNILDTFEVDLDDRGISLIALNAPIASDLRLVTVAMKISRDLERVGDEATTIARRVIELNAEPQLKPYVDIPRMATLALGMLKDSLDAFVEKDSAKARAVVPRDKEVDNINRQLHRELVSFMIERPTSITRALHLMTISKALERIADHAANIAEEVVFLYESRDIRHQKTTNDPT